MCCYVALSNVFNYIEWSHVDSYFTTVSHQRPAKKARPVKAVKVCLCFILYHYTWYSIWSAWFLDIRTLTC